MGKKLSDIVAGYNANSPLAEAHTIPSSWYVDARIAELENDAVFGRNWQAIGRASQVAESGQFFTAEVAGERIVVVRGPDRELRAFYNVCRHHAAAVVTEAEGHAANFRCPYHGWTYGIDGTLKGTPDFDGVCDFDRSQNGLAPVRVATWEKFVFVNLDANAGSLEDFLAGLMKRVAPLRLASLHFFERRSYELNCNWKVYVDNFLDGGYHVPYLHKGLNSVLDYANYTIENEDRFCLQSSPVETSSANADADAAATRQGNRAFYFWQYPNFMLNWYAGYLDTNLVLPLSIDRCRVIFDFYFADTGDSAKEYNQQSVAVSHRVQEEDTGICEAVQRGLHSRAYVAGRLSVRREAGEHLFHRLLHADLKAALARTANLSEQSRTAMESSAKEEC
ncbi:MAG TPA: aromatic ring-hydroxylating dioxygenase subunit alpha [Candidatus Acidoferrales bacterium]|nr:aromatic ring-hydroxylating dioxygenase subunit alpha [Candidatus Acidoferrales bacterium]